MQSDVSICRISARSVSACVVIVTRRDRRDTKEPRCTAGVMAAHVRTPSPQCEPRCKRCISTHRLCKWAVLGIYLLMKRACVAKLACGFTDMTAIVAVLSTSS